MGDFVSSLDFDTVGDIHPPHSLTHSIVQHSEARGFSFLINSQFLENDVAYRMRKNRLPASPYPSLPDISGCHLIKILNHCLN